MVEPRWEVKIGSQVTATDSDYGRLQQLLVHPHGWLPYHPLIVPENAIAEASENEVRLNLSRERCWRSEALKLPCIARSNPLTSYRHLRAGNIPIPMAGSRCYLTGRDWRNYEEKTAQREKSSDD